MDIVPHTLARVTPNQWELFCLIKGLEGPRWLARLDELQTLAQRGLGSQQFYLWLVDFPQESDWSLAAPAPLAKHLASLPAEAWETPARWSHGDSTHSFAAQEAAILNAENYARLPLIWGEKQGGCLILAASGQSWGLPEHLLAESLASNLASLIESLLMERQTKLAESLYAASYRMALLATGTQDMTVVLNNIITEAIELMEVSGAEIMLLEDGFLHTVTTAGQKRVYHLPELIRIGVGASGQAALQRRSVFITDYNNYPHAIPEIVNDGQMRGVIATPMIAKDQLLGVLLVFQLDGDNLPIVTQDDLQILQTLAPLAALAIENAQLHDVVRQERGQLHALLDHIQLPIMLFDSQSQLVMANPAAHNIGRRLNMSLYSLIGHSIEDITALLPDDIELPSSYTLGDNIEMQLGSAGEFMLRVAEVPGLIGNIGGYVVVGQEVTAERRLSRARSELIDLLSHDLGNILSLALGYAALLLEDDSGSEETHVFLKRIFDALERARTLIHDVVEIDYAETHGAKVIKPYRLTHALEGIIEALQPLAETKNQTLQLDLSEGKDQDMMGNSALIKQALENLVSNAIKYTLEGGMVTVKLSGNATHAIIEVKDTGIGIAAQEVSKIWDRFYRINSEATRKVEGRGLGLNLVRSVIQSHNGYLEVESVLGEGSVFRVFLPYERN